ncbi:TetR-like C-terminal domain-containing protein [Inconstantimicrobium mannanitabidum]|uniref:TetR family transcriptional regulator n=1 Tax=Inconstantimicrobium mannanitabidum TaxID=1604901 RepID=A0ACB5RIF0_9CLOT|nr:TetR-like C-terminal domain-containing protein [Clostridium sp. TW13]GKX68856.1 TetR family transcriptional regulator [Clostridium sp. TW13]
MSQTTKKALATSLKKLSMDRPLDKITVVDIVEDCEVNRQTFYYHFNDIYDLVEWVYLSEATKALGDKKTYDTWQQGFLQLFEYVLNNKAFVNNTYHSVSREHLERYLYNESYNLLIDVVEEQAAGIPVREEDKKFIADFYKYAFVGLMVDWIRTGMKVNPEDIISKLDTLIHGQINSAIEKFRTD